MSEVPEKLVAASNDLAEAAEIADENDDHGVVRAATRLHAQQISALALAYNSVDESDLELVPRGMDTDE